MEARDNFFEPLSNGEGSALSTRRMVNMSGTESNLGVIYTLVVGQPTFPSQTPTMMVRIDFQLYTVV